MCGVFRALIQRMNIRLFILRRISYIVVLLETLTQHFWRALTWAGLFAALWLFNLPVYLSNIFNLLLLLVAMGGFIAILARDIKGFSLPTRRDVDRRLETNSALKHRPLSGADDEPISDTDKMLWLREKQRKARLLGGLKPPSPRPMIAVLDKRGFRLAILIALICGFVVAGEERALRLTQGLMPFREWTTGQEQATSQIAFWITPPEYTQIKRIEPLAAQAALQIPQGSKATLNVPSSVFSGLFPPTLIAGEKEFETVLQDDGTYSLEAELPRTDSLTLRTGLFKRRQWDVQYIPDTPPQIKILEEPKALSNAQVQVPVGLYDDYGVERLHMRMMLDPSVGAPPLGWPFEEMRSVLSPPKTDFQIAPVYDLASHPWAGLPVTFTFTAHDHQDQIAQSAPVKFVLPERNFTHPVAQKIIEVRKYLTWNADAPYRESAMALEGLLYRPDLYGYDTRVYLPLRSAASRLYYNEPSADVSLSVIALLWDIALYLEDGNLSLAARDFKAAQQELERLLQDPNATESEISAAMQRLRESFAEYMLSLAREMQKNMAENGQMQLPPEMLGQIMSMDDLAAMLDQMEADMMAGDKSAAQDMLSKLQRLMDMTNPANQQAMPPDMQMMQQGINELQELVERQEKLRDQTSKQAELMDMMQGFDINDFAEQFGLDAKDLKKEETPFVDTSEHKGEQEALRYMLGQLMLAADEKIGEIPESMGLAEQAMRNSESQLGENRPALSVTFQDEALEHLKNAQQQMAQQLAQRMQQMTGFSFGGMAGGMQYDPLGRPMMGEQDGDDNPGIGSDIEVPSESSRKRVREILEELRSRAAQRGRPQEELEYYRRLLKRF